jgi:hypothetical protein
MRRFLVALLGAPVGYIVLASAGYWAIELFSNNAFDRSPEANIKPCSSLVRVAQSSDLSRDWFWAA